VADAECRCQFLERHNRRVAPAVLQAADVLLAEAGDLGELPLGQTSDYEPGARGDRGNDRKICSKRSFGSFLSA
jgi:hypothetical protein